MLGQGCGIPDNAAAVGSCAPLQWATRPAQGLGSVALQLATGEEELCLQSRKAGLE